MPFNVAQDITGAFNFYRRGKSLVLNPEELYVSVGGWHSSYDRYVKFNGSNHELAEIQITGAYGGPARPFMWSLKDKIDRNKGHYSRQIFNENIMYDRHQRGWIVDWDAICYELENICIQNLMPEVSAEMPPINSKSQKKKNKYGYGGEPTLYASGQLAESIYVGVL